MYKRNITHEVFEKMFVFDFLKSKEVYSMNISEQYLAFHTIASNVMELRHSYVALSTMIYRVLFFKHFEQRNTSMQ